MIKPTPHHKSQRNGINRNGRRTETWQSAWRWLKPRLERAGRTSCEFRTVLPHGECYGPLDPVHAHKRREATGEKLYYVAIGCRKIHDRLDLKMSHAEMEKAVMIAIRLAGGLILPSDKRGGQPG